MLFYGWDIGQWAAAKCWYQAQTGIDLSPTIKNAIELKHLWLTKRIDEPLAVSIIGVMPEKDYTWGIELLEQASFTSHLPRFNPQTPA